MRKFRVSHDRADESLEAKVQWFRSLTMEERMDYFVEMADLVFEINPAVFRSKHVEPIEGRVSVFRAK
jgi:hypothetical protein